MIRPPLRYRLLGTALAPLLAGHALRRALRDGGHVYLRERFGCIAATAGPSPVWIHCASVGEVITALPLLEDERVIETDPSPDTPPVPSA